jgi:hypothetical protein
MKTEYFLSNMAGRAKTTAVLICLIAICAAAFAASGSSLSELLEKGIYSEETKGDLDAAMQLYKQVASEAQAGQALGAQAQYRLGVCYYKKKNYAEASAAFEKLIADFPDQTALIAKAREYLAGSATLMPAPWVDGEQQRMDLKFPTGFKIGAAQLTVQAAESDGRKLWRLHCHIFAGVQQVSRVEVEAETFRPLHSRWMHTLIGDADTTYTSTTAEVKLVGKSEVKKVDLGGPIYDNEEVIQAMRRLPLTTNYSTTVRVLTSLGGGAIIPLKIEVVGVERVEVPAGAFDCYKVELSLHQTFWYSTDAHRYLVKFEAGGVVAELTEVKQQALGQPVRYADAVLSLSAPPDWMFFASPTKDSNTRARLVMLDPGGRAEAETRVQTLDSLNPDARKSARAWAESIIAKDSDARATKVRADSWQERTVAGKSGLSFIADFEEANVKKVAYGVCIFVDKDAVLFNLEVPIRDFEDLRPAFDAIVDSYKAP